MNKIPKITEIPLSQISTKIGSGATPRGGKESYKETGISLIRSQNVYDFYFDRKGLAFIDNVQADELSNVSIESDDILLNITGASVGRCCVVPSNVLPARVNQHVSIIRVDSTKADCRYVMYTLNNPNIKGLLLNLAQGGATREALTKEIIENFKIPLPPLEIQSRISSALSPFDDLIENNLQRIQILEEMAQTIYTEWFVNFRFPGHENVHMVESELGMIPEGWEVKSIGEFADLFRGKSYSSDNLVNEGGLPFINLKCIQRYGGFRIEGLKRFSGDYKDSHLAKPGDIVIAVTDMTQERMIVAHPARVPNIGEEVFVVSMDLVRLVPKKQEHASFLYSYLRFSDFSENVKQYANGANVLHLIPDRIMEYRFIQPQDEVIADFCKKVDSIYQLIDILNNMNRNLRIQRDLLLPKLLSSEIGTRL